MTSRTSTIETRHYRRATELSPAKTKQENDQALKRLKKNAAHKQVQYADIKPHTWKDAALVVLCVIGIYLSIVVLAFAAQG